MNELVVNDLVSPTADAYEPTLTGKIGVVVATGVEFHPSAGPVVMVKFPGVRKPMAFYPRNLLRQAVIDGMEDTVVTDVQEGTNMREYQHDQLAHLSEDAPVSESKAPQSVENRKKAAEDRIVPFTRTEAESLRETVYPELQRFVDWLYEAAPQEVYAFEMPRSKLLRMYADYRAGGDE